MYFFQLEGPSIGRFRPRASITFVADRAIHTFEPAFEPASIRASQHSSQPAFEPASIRASQHSSQPAFELAFEEPAFEEPAVEPAFEPAFEPTFALDWCQLVTIDVVSLPLISMLCRHPSVSIRLRN
ncbi:hypothetical protein PG985_002856 [Apiospora marii]|uniref:uncharacterized protein n=1 Tax=Apiospora marii TaxID=335849 RepID=UPI00312FFE7B